MFVHDYPNIWLITGLINRRTGNNDISGIREYISMSKSYKSLTVTSPTLSFQYFGWVIDLKDNRLVMVAGAKDMALEKFPHTEKMTIGGYDGRILFERDSLVATAELLQINKILRVFNPNTGTAYQVVGALDDILCERPQSTSSVCQEDIAQIFGKGKTMFEPGN